MAHDEARANRIRSLKDRFPDLKWRQIADYVGVRERSVYAWPKTGGIDRENVKKLAEFFQRELGATDVTAEWIWRGDTETPDLMNTLNGNGNKSQLDRIETEQRAIHAKLDAILNHLGIEPETISDAVEKARGRLGGEGPPPDSGERRHHDRRAA